MTADKIQALSPVAPPAAPQRQPASPEEAAQQFEEVLVRQFVQTMTKGLFDGNMAGDDGPGWMGAYGEMQQDALTDALTGHLVDQGTLRISDMLMRQWGRQHAADAAGSTPNDATQD